jgi:hypothetical protein
VESVPGLPLVRSVIINAVIVVASLSLSVVACEVGLRLLYPHGALGSGVELEFFRRDQGARWMSNLMMPDEAIGFRPKPSTVATTRMACCAAHIQSNPTYAEEYCFSGIR